MINNKKLTFFIVLLSLFFNFVYSQNITVSDDTEFLNAMLNESYTTIILESGSKKYENFDFNRSVNIICDEDTYFKGIFNFSSDNLYFENCIFEISRSNYDYIINVTEDISNLTFKNVSLIDDTTSYNNDVVFFIAENKIENSNISINQMIKDSSETDKYTGLSFSNLDNSTIKIFETNLDEPLLLFGDFTFNDTENILENYNYIQNDNMLKTYSEVQDTLLNLEGNSNIFFNENFGSSLLEIDFLQKNNLSFFSKGNEFTSRIIFKNYTDLIATFNNFTFSDGIEFSSDINYLNFSNSNFDLITDSSDGMILENSYNIDTLIFDNSIINPTDLENDDYILKFNSIKNLEIYDSVFYGKNESLLKEQSVENLISYNSTYSNFENIFHIDMENSNLEGYSNYNSFYNTENPFLITNYNEDNHYNATLNYYDNIVGIDEEHLINEPFCIDSTCDTIINEILKEENSTITQNGTIVEIDSSMNSPIYIYIEEGVNENVYLNLNNFSEDSRTFKIPDIIVTKYLEDNQSVIANITNTTVEFLTNTEDKIISLLNYYEDSSNINNKDGFGVGFDFSNSEAEVINDDPILITYKTNYNNLEDFNLYQTLEIVSEKDRDGENSTLKDFDYTSGTINFSLNGFYNFYFYEEKIVTTSSSSSSSSSKSYDEDDIEEDLKEYEKGIVIDIVKDLFDLKTSDLKKIENVKEQSIKMELEKDYSGSSIEEDLDNLIAEGFRVLETDKVELRKTLYKISLRNSNKKLYMTKIDFDDIEVGYDFSNLYFVNYDLDEIIEDDSEIDGKYKTFDYKSFYSQNLAFSNKIISDIELYYYIDSDVYTDFDNTKVIALEKRSIDEDIINTLEENNYDISDYEEFLQQNLVLNEEEENEEENSSITQTNQASDNSGDNPLTANFILVATNPLVAVIFFLSLLGIPYFYRGNSLFVLKNMKPKKISLKLFNFKKKTNPVEDKSIDEILSKILK